MVEHPNLVVVHTCGSQLEADLAMCALEAAEIQALLQADTAGGMREHPAWTGAGLKILVREDDVTAAREALTPPTGTLLNDRGERLDGEFLADGHAHSSLRRFT